MQIDTLYLPIRDFWMVVFNTNLPYLFGSYFLWCLLSLTPWNFPHSWPTPSRTSTLLPLVSPPFVFTFNLAFWKFINKQHGPTFHSKSRKLQLSKGGFLFLRKVHNLFLALSHPNWSNEIVWLKLGNLLNIYRGLTAVVLGQFRQIWHLNSIDNMSSTWVLWDHQEFVACQRAWNSIHPPKKKKNMDDALENVSILTNMAFFVSG